MMFGLGCCCVGSGGIYDFYALGGAIGPVDDFLDNETIIARNASNQIIITGYMQNDTSSVSSPAKQSSTITSYLVGSYFDMWTSGDYLRRQFDIRPVAMNLVGQERLWVHHRVSNNQDYIDYFNHSGFTGADSIRATGSGMYASGDYIILNTDSPTNGCYIKWNFPTGGPIVTEEVSFDIPSNYDKTILTTIEELNGWKTEHWYKPSGPTFAENNVAILYTGGIPVSTGTDDSFDRSEYRQEVGQSDEWTLIKYYPESSDTSGIKSLEFRLVDDLTGYIIDDISGFSLQIKNLRMPHSIGTGALNWRTPSGNRLLSYLDPVGESILFSKILRADEYYHESLTGIDYYKYRGSALPVTDLYGKKNTSFSVNGFGEVLTPFYSPEIGASYLNSYTGGFIINRLISNNIGNPVWSEDSEGVSFSANGTSILGFETKDEILSNPFIFYDTEGTDWRDNFALSSSELSNEIGPYMAWAVDRKQEHVGNNPLYHQLFKTIDTTGTDSFLYSAPIHWFLIEHDVPVEEKIFFYQRAVVDSSGRYSGHWNALDLDNYNSEVILPKICCFDKRDAPNCFSVQLPKENYIHATGHGSHRPTGLVNQTVKILYGPPKQEQFTIYALSGQYANFYNTGRTDFTGMNGNKRPVFDTFNYSGVGPGSSFTFPSGGNVYAFTYDLVFGDTEGEVFWEDSFEQNITYTPFYTPNTIVTPAGGYTGLHYSPRSLNVTAHLVNGCVHIPTNTRAGLFLHSRNHAISGALSYSGEAYIKLQIGTNVVYNERIYTESQHGYDFGYLPVHGPYALHATEPDQRSSLSGSYAAFVWFEKIYKTPPIAHKNEPATGVGEATGWKMHVSNDAGTDLWTVLTSGHRHWELSDTPHVVDSSDRFFYVNDFFMPYPNVTYDSVYSRCNGYSYSPYSGYFFIAPDYDFSGAGMSWGFSHDGRAIIPGATHSHDTEFPFNASSPFFGTSRQFPSGMEHNVTNYLYGHSIKNSSLLPLTPRVEDWLKPTGFPEFTRYDVITGLNPFFPSGCTPVDEESFPHMLISPTGFNMAEYPGYQYIYTGINWIQYFSDEIVDNIPYYIASGTQTGGWL
jgi:hypothetical protein